MPKVQNKRRRHSIDIVQLISLCLIAISAKYRQILFVYYLNTLRYAFRLRIPAGSFAKKLLYSVGDLPQDDDFCSSLSELLRHYNVRTGVLDSIPDTTWLIDQSHLNLLMLELFEFETIFGDKFKLSVFTDKGYYYRPGCPLTLKQTFSLSEKLHHRKYFYLEFQFEGSSLVISRQVFTYVHHRHSGLCILSQTSFVTCSKFHIADLNYFYPLASADKIFESNSISSPDNIGPVDAVITWVNRDDSKWQELWRRRFPATSQVEIVSSSADADPSQIQDPDRFTSNDELRFCLRSINAHLPWIRKTYIVSNCSPPTWLNLDADRIQWIWHEEIIPAEYLPTFNSHSIEACLHKIPNLSTRFLYINDDVIILKPTSRCAFFDAMGRPYINAESYALASFSYLKINTKDYMQAAANSINALRLIGKKLPKCLNLHAHIPLAHHKDVVSRLESEVPDFFAMTIASPLRSKHDLNIMSFTAVWYGYALGEYVFNALVNSIDYLLVRPSNIKKLVARDAFPRFACFNDGDGTSNMKSYKQSVANYLSNHLPVPSFCEHMQPPRAT